MNWQFPFEAVGESRTIGIADNGAGDGRRSRSSDCVKTPARVTDTIADTDVWAKPQQQRDKKSLINFNALWIRPSLIGTC